MPAAEFAGGIAEGNVMAARSAGTIGYDPPVTAHADHQELGGIHGRRPGKHRVIVKALIKRLLTDISKQFSACIAPPASLFLDEVGPF